MSGETITENLSTPKRDIHWYDKIFTDLFTTHVEKRDGGIMVTWKLKKGPSHVTGWIFFQPAKKKWLRKPIMLPNNYTIIDSHLNPIHKFMDEFICYDEDSFLYIRNFFINRSKMEASKEGV